jgi:hypothetical protein
MAGVVALEVGATQACGIDAQGTLLCFGEDEWGQLGLGGWVVADDPIPIR